ncbi:MAG: DUF507 family protein [Campylobacteraceae bacterium]|jgi:hypothetical protein|nr:DUF507 family protein [Campylobacteraceae bacterium]
MKIRLPHAPYIASKIAVDLLNSGFVTLQKGFEPIVEDAKILIVEEINKEAALEQRVSEMLDENSEEMEFRQIDRRNMFWLVKKRLAKDYKVILSFEERYSDLSHRILNKLQKDGLVKYQVSENRVKNVIYNAIEEYLKTYERTQDIVLEKIDNYKRKLIPGTEEYDLVFERLYEEELRKKGMIK